MEAERFFSYCVYFYKASSSRFLMSALVRSFFSMSFASRLAEFMLKPV